jgi:predicted glycoside hydrolase/deacetylase ChbG (UPF0249 family)
MPKMFNRFLKNMGFNESDKVVIFHADDVGMCSSSVSAFTQLMEMKALSSGSTMVPCSWFPSIADYCKTVPGTDLGVHTTFTSEWSSYRWRPLSTCDQSSGLIDADGYFPKTVAQIQKTAVPAYIEAELNMQVNKALESGVDVSHIDMHMGAMLHPNFLPAYVEAGVSRGIPVLAYRMSREQLSKWNNPELADLIPKIIESLEMRGFPVIDNFYQTNLSMPDSRLEELKQQIKLLKPGLTHIILHPAEDTPELRDICPDWSGRHADLEVLRSKEFNKFVQNEGIVRIGYRDLRDAMVLTNKAF